MPLIGLIYVTTPRRELPESPLKLAAPVQPTLRRLSSFDNIRFRGCQRFQFSDECRNLFVSGDLSELFLCHQESRPDPALSLVAAMP